VSELEQLRADLEVLDRYFNMYLADAKAILRDKIAKLEAEADPWRYEKNTVSDWERMPPSTQVEKVARYVRHLEADNAAKAERIARLEYELQCEVVDGGAVRDQLKARLAELEKEPEFTPAVLKRADEIDPGDMIVASGKIRLVTGTARHAVQYRMQITCDDWGAWFDPGDILAVLRKPLVEPYPLEGDK
jgi:small nuclear ribonucleoprotein (snRNP)-like protein